jgi:hypothetical protein
VWRLPGGVGLEPTRNSRAQNKAIRDWARDKKIDLSDRGRIPHTIVEQYQADEGR